MVKKKPANNDNNATNKLTAAPIFSEDGKFVRHRSQEELETRTREVLTNASIISLENLVAAGFYSTDEVNRLTWEMLNNPKFNDSQKARIQAIRSEHLPRSKD